NATTEALTNLEQLFGTCQISWFTLFYALNDTQQDLLKRAINSVDHNLLNFVGETTDDNSTSHKIVHICTNILDRKEGNESVEDVEIMEVEVNAGKSSTSTSSAVTRPDKEKSVIEKGKPFYSMSTLEFASDYVSEEIMDKLLNNYKVQKLLNGGSFKTRPLFETTVSCFGVNNSKLSIPTWGKWLFSDISEIMTISESHPIVKNGLEKYINKNDNSDIKFYFVLLKEIYDSYQEQVLYSTKRTVIKNRPPWINRLKQYTLEIDLKL
ncbi:21065_t:CDS:2, partial [Dentiscutata erythropus]